MTNVTATGQAWPSSAPYPSVSSNSGVASSDSASSSTSSSTTSPPYISPATRVDPQTGIAVLVVLDDSGQVTEQIPTRQVIDEYRRHQEPSQDGHQATASTTPAQQSADHASPEVAGASSTAPAAVAGSGSGSQGTFA